MRLHHLVTTYISLLCSVLLISCRRETPSRNYNVLLITIDTIRADRVGAYGYRSAVTPALDRLAREGARFDQASSAVPLTLPSHATILSGLLPPQHGLRNNGVGSFPSSERTLATFFKQRGYRTAAFVSAFVLDRRFGLARDFDVYDDEIDTRPEERGRLEAERGAATTVDRLLTWLEASSGEPFFGWVHLYDPHAPYAPPEPYRTRFSASTYDGEVAYVDAQIARVIASLERRGMLDSTLIVVMGDHGEALGEHGELTHGLLLYEPTLRVPLLMRGAGIAAGITLRRPVSLADVAPTIARLATRDMLQPVDRVGGGRDLSSALEKGDEPAATVIYAETEYPSNFGWAPIASARDERFKLVKAPRPELYELATDEREARNVLDTQRRHYRRLNDALDAIRSNVATAPKPAVLDRETAAKLASLGYVAPAVNAPAEDAADPKDRVALFRKFEEATWALAREEKSEAADILEELVKADAANPVFRTTLARLARERGDLSRAIELYRDAIAAKPDDADGWYNLAVAFEESGDARRAAEAVREAIARDPAHPEAHNALGIALTMEGKLRDARAEFERVIALDPRNARAFNNLGNVFRAEEKFAEAEAAYRRAIELSPRYADPLNGLGALQVQRDRAAEAIQFFDRALALEPSQIEVLMNRGIAREVSGDTVGAAADYRSFLARSEGRSEFASQREGVRQLLRRLTTR